MKRKVIEYVLSLSFMPFGRTGIGLRPVNGHLQESPGFPGPKSPKSLKRVSPGLPARSVQNVSKRVEMSQKSVKKEDSFETFRLFSKLFGALRAGRPRETLLRLFGDFGPEKPGDSCKRPLTGLNDRTLGNDVHENSVHNRCPCWRYGLDGPNRQSPIASVQRTPSTLAGHSAIPHGKSTTPTNANRTIWITAQRTQGLRGPNSVLSWGNHGEIWQPTNALQKCVVKFWFEIWSLWCEISGEILGGETFRPAISGRISGQLSAKFSETSFQISRLSSETSFSRRAVLMYDDCSNAATVPSLRGT